MIIFSRLLKKEGKKDKPPKYPCRSCVYYKACGNGGRREPCPTRKTKEEYDELIREENLKYERAEYGRTEHGKRKQRKEDLK